MIVFLFGKIASKKPTEIVLNVAGVGYRVFIPTSSFDALKSVGEEVLIYTHHYVREETQALYGFHTTTARSVFESLISVSGIGPKLALAVLSALTPTELESALSSADDTYLTRIPGVGKKTAQRMILELRDKIVGLGDSGSLEGTAPDASSVEEDALAALVTLGLSRSLAEKKIKLIRKKHSGGLTVEELTRLALRTR